MTFLNDSTMTRRGFMKQSAIAGAGLAVGMASAGNAVAGPADQAEIKKTRSFHPDMEYRRLGQTGLWVSAVCLGGHWKRINKIIGPIERTGGAESAPQGSGESLNAFHQNRRDVVSRCIEVGINLVDFAGAAEPPVYARALEGRREAMYIAWSMGAQELRHPEHRTKQALLDILDKGLQDTGLEYVDIWRLMVHERGNRHTGDEIEAMINALETAKQQGKCRFTGMSTHDRPWAKKIIAQYPGMIQVLCTPYTADSKELPKDSLFDTVKQQDVGVLGIKPFASNSLFAGDGSPDSPQAAEDDKRARMAIRYILANPAITAPIPGLVSVHQVDNMVQAVRERRELGAAEELERRRIAGEMWARLPHQYEWLRDWQHV